MIAPLAALLLAAAAPAFPPPTALPQDENLKYATGTIEATDPAGHFMILSTPSGSLTLNIDQVLAFGTRGTAEPLKTELLRPGQNVRVYFYIDNGARARELDLAQ